MLVSNLLEQKGDGVATVPASASVATVVAELARHGVGVLVVSPDGQAIDGIVSERDIVRHLSELRMSLLSEPVTAIMSTTVRTCTPDDDVAAIMSLMTEQRIRHVPVLDGARLCGIVSIGDIVKSRIGELEKDRSELLEYITAR